MTDKPQKNKNIVFQKANSADNPINTPLLLSPRSRWVKTGSLFALTGYVSQMAFQLLAVSGFWLAHSSQAMERDYFSGSSVHNGRYYYTDEDVGTCVNAMIASGAELERAPGTTYLLKPKGGESLTFSGQESVPYYAALLPACSRIAGIQNIDVPAVPVTWFLDKDNQSNEIDALLQRLLECNDRIGVIDCIKQRRQETSANYEILEDIIGEDEQEKDIAEIRQNLESARLFRQSQRKDAFDELLDQTLDLPNAYYKIVFPFCRDNSHWYVGEIWGEKKSLNEYAFTVMAHNPYGGGDFEGAFSQDLIHIRQSLGKKLGVENLELKSEISPFNRRQRERDGISCGPIMVDDLFKVILGQSLDIDQPYEYGALSLRKKQIDLVRAATGSPLVTRDESEKFLKKNERWVRVLENSSKNDPIETTPRMHGIPFQTEDSAAQDHGLVEPGVRLKAFLERQEQNPEQERLFESVLNATGAASDAAYNWPGRVKMLLASLGRSVQEPTLKTKIEQLTTRLKQPEDLLFFGPHESERILYRSGLTAESGVFSIFRALYEQMDALSNQLEATNQVDGGFRNIDTSQTVSIRKELEQLRRFYEMFVADLCVCGNNEKDLLLEPKVLLTVEKPFDSYRISQEVARQLISRDRYGFVDKKNATGMRAVQSRHGVHFKFLDSSLDDPRPGIEYMAYAFAKALSPEFLVTPSVLAKIENVSLFDTAENFPPELLEAKRQGKSLDEALVELQLSHEGGWQERLKLKQYNCFLQASRTIGKQDFAKVLEANPRFEGDPVNLGWQFLFALLTNPGDGKTDNYSVDERGAVIGIDNDKIFYPPLYQTAEGLSTGINCIFYLLDSLMDAPLNHDVQKSFLSLNPALVVLQWLASLQEKNDRYQKMTEQRILSACDLETLGLPIRLSKNLPGQIMDRITSLQKYMRDDTSLTPQQLFRKVYPLPADYYQALRERYKGDPLLAMTIIYKGRDEDGNSQKINHVLNLSPEYPSWREAQRKCMNPLDDELVSCVKQFMKKMPIEFLMRNPNGVFSLVASRFPAHEREFFPELPEGAWQGVIQEQGERGIYDKPVLEFLMRRDPAGLNRPDAWNRTPLDVAFDHLPVTQNAIVDLVDCGAWQMSFSGPLYRKLKKTPELSDAFWKAFESLERRNAKLRWMVTLEELFPLSEKDAGPSVIRGASGEMRLLTDDTLKQLENRDNHIREGRRQVVRVENNGHVAFIKFDPELVGFEEVIGDLTRTLIGFGAPYGELFRFPKGEPAWVSQGIAGDSLQWVLANDPSRLEKLDPVSTFNMILMAMLVNPEDGKPDNYIVEPLPDNPNRYRLSSPDNDHGFVPAFVRAAPDRGNILRKGEPVVQVKTILYCLDQMCQPIPEETRVLFLKANPVEVMRQWITRAIHTAERYQSLYKGQELFNFFKEKECFIGIPFQKGMVAHVYGKWGRLQEFLQDADLREEGLTPLELLSKLEPRLAGRYQAAFVGNALLWDRFKKIDGVFYHESGKTLTVSGNILTSHNIPLQESVVQSIQQGKSLGPLQAMEELKEIARQLGDPSVVFQQMATDLQRESYLKRLDFAERSLNNQNALLGQITSYVKDLRTLFLKNCSAINSSRLLKEFFVGQLVDLSLQGCVNVTHDIIKTLAKEMPGLERLNLSNLPKLKRVARQSNGSDSLVFEGLSHLNLNDCTALKTIDIEAPKLKRLWIDRDKQLKIFRVKASQLQSLSCEEILLTSEMLSSGLSEVLNLKHLSFKNCPNFDEDAIPDRLLNLPSEEEAYQRFLNGALIYKPNANSDEGMVTLPIQDLDNPLGGVFDLSQIYEGISDRMSISTGYWKWKEEKPKKYHYDYNLEIWFAFRPLVKKELNGPASHLKLIFGRWKKTVPVGIFWRWGGWDDIKFYKYMVQYSWCINTKTHLKTSLAVVYDNSFETYSDHMEYHQPMINGFRKNDYLLNRLYFTM